MARSAPSTSAQRWAATSFRVCRSAAASSVGRQAQPLCLADVVHADSRYRLDARVDLGSRQAETATAAHTEHADPLTIDERQPTEEVDARAEVLDEGLP